MLQRRLKQSLLAASLVIIALLVALLIRSMFSADSIVLSRGGITRTEWETIWAIDARGNRVGPTWDMAEVSTQGASVSLSYDYGNLRIEWYGSPRVVANGMRRHFVWHDGDRVFGWAISLDASLTDQIWPPVRVWNHGGYVLTVFGMSTGFTGRGAGVDPPDWALHLPLPLLMLITSLPSLIWLRRRARARRRRGFEPIHVGSGESQGDATGAD